MSETDYQATSWHSYPSIYAMGHRALTDLFADPVVIEEKIDGSQFSFGLFNDGLRVRSKGKVMLVDAPEKMFQRAVDAVKELPLTPGWTYRAEYLAKPKHNSLSYDRAPNNNLIIFDINTGEEAYLPYAEKAEEAARLGFETVPLLHDGLLEDRSVFTDLLIRMSYLGGVKVEGVVVKNYFKFGPDKKALMGKYVSEAFKEVPAKEWKLSNSGQLDVVQGLIAKYRTEARWQKALRHLAEAGKIEGTPRDISVLMKEVWPDVEKECEDEIKDALYGWAKDKIRRGVIAGLPEWYKERLLDRQFDS